MKTLALILTSLLLLASGCNEKRPPAPPTSKQLALLALSRMSAVAVTYRCKNRTVDELKIGREFMDNVYAMDKPPKKHIRRIKSLSVQYYYCVFGCVISSCRAFVRRAPGVHRILER